MPLPSRVGRSVRTSATNSTRTRVTRRLARSASLRPTIRGASASSVRTHRSRTRALSGARSSAQVRSPEHILRAPQLGIRLDDAQWSISSLPSVFSLAYLGPRAPGAVKDCQLNCPNQLCTLDDSGMPCIAPYTCVVQDDQWAQCIGEAAVSTLLRQDDYSTPLT